MSPELKAWLRGLVRSWTAWLGALLIALPEIWPQLAPIVTEVLGPDAGKRLTQIVGVLIILLRVKTSQSLKEKGDAQPPA